MEESETAPTTASARRYVAGPLGARGTSNRLDHWLLKQILAGMGNPSVLLRLWDGHQASPPGCAPVGELQIRDRGALYRLARFPELEFGELYSRGRLEVLGDLPVFLEAVYRGIQQVRPGLPRQALDQIRRLRRNDLNRARHNIHHHYDIGNDFYRLWLDRQLVYTCAYFPHEDCSLEQAQVAKFDHVARKLWMQPGETVVEAGCGWGALALHLAREYGVRVRAYNISREQLGYARERARAEGLDDRVEFIEGDYREISGECDLFVSVGMLEHVGLRHYRELGEAIDRCLRPDGRGLIHSIGRNRPGTLNPWITKHIFPGAHPPSLGEMAPLFEPWGFSVLDVENLRLHYAKTLEHWLARFDLAAEQVREMFDAEFERAWRLYLAGSTAAFRVGTLQLFQVLFTRGSRNDIPWTRAHLYRDG
jgi:cyclopropane-fatty-acyl-phospholipid synthase